LDWLRLEKTELEIRQNFLMMPFEKGGLKPLFFGQQPTLLTAISILTTLGILLIPITNKGLSNCAIIKPN
jgi:hypothetical protein